MHPDQRHAPPTCGLGSRTTLGFHPRDGRPVACWVVHPTGSGLGQDARTARFVAALGLGDLTAPELADVSAHRGSVTAAGGWATLWVGDETELVATHDDAWLDALLERGWAMVVVGWSPLLEDADNSAVQQYLTGAGRAHAGVVRAA